MKKVLDERQTQITARIGAFSFHIMFFVCAVTIIIELLCYKTLENVWGETIILMAGGVACLGGNLRNGIWQKGSHSTILPNLLLSILCSGIFSILYALIIYQKAPQNTFILLWIGIFFAVITALCFFTLSILGRIAKQKEKKQAQKYYSD